MRIECERCLVFAAGLIVGAGAYAMVKNGKAKKAAVWNVLSIIDSLYAQNQTRTVV